MAYDEDLANRLREMLANQHGVTEKAMFGGLAFLVNGNLAVSASGQGGLLLRADPAQTEELTRAAHAQPFMMRGRAMDGWLRVEPDGIETDAQLSRWVGLGVARALDFPPK
ncbi:MAG: TfoX/Sxy family protein [Actinomycetota bacterium]|nr:TfoX/Sxy family protein [Actinomycetota bacterium]